MKKLKKLKRNIKKWLIEKFAPEYAFLPMSRIGYHPPTFEKVEHSEWVTEDVYEYLQKDDTKYDAVYGILREMAEQLKPYAVYETYYNPEMNRWKLKVSLQVRSDEW